MIIETLGGLVNNLIATIVTIPLDNFLAKLYVVLNLLLQLFATNLQG